MINLAEELRIICDTVVFCVGSAKKSLGRTEAHTTSCRYGCHICEIDLISSIVR